MIETDSDRLELLKALGEEIQFDGQSIWGVFEMSYFDIDLDSPVEGSTETVTVRTIDIPSRTRGSSVVRGNTSYTVVGSEPDGDGITTLRLDLA